MIDIWLLAKSIASTDKRYKYVIFRLITYINLEIVHSKSRVRLQIPISTVVLSKMFKFLFSISAILLLTSEFSEALGHSKIVVLDRTVKNFKSPGYYVQPVDITTFSVNRAIPLKQFDISKIFVYDPVKEIPIDHVRVNFKIVQKLKTNPQHNREIFFGNTIISSKVEAQVPTDIKLKPDFDYEIQIEMPENLQLMYLDFLEIREFKIKKWFGRSIFVNFHQHNLGIKPPGVTDDKRKNSQGIVNRIHLQNPWFF